MPHENPDPDTRISSEPRGGAGYPARVERPDLAAETPAAAVSSPAWAAAGPNLHLVYLPMLWMPGDTINGMQPSLIRKCPFPAPHRLHECQRWEFAIDPGDELQDAEETVARLTRLLNDAEAMWEADLELTSSWPECAGPGPVYTLAFIKSRFHEPAAIDTNYPARVGGPSRWNSATVHGDLDPDLLDAEIEISFSKFGEATPKGRWQTKSGTVRDVFDWLSTHEIGDKDGMCLMQGALVGGDRSAAAVKHQDFLILDIDSGEPLEAVHERIRRFGKMALCYTTHSHLKSESSIKRDDIYKKLKLDSSEEVTVEHIVTYLTEHKGYHPDILVGAKISKVEHTPKGVLVFVSHARMPKARVVFVLAQRFSFSEGGTQAERTKAWKESYAGVAKALNLPIDKSCTDIPRLFFLPRHDKGAPCQIDIFPGDFLDLQSIERVTLRELNGGPSGADDPFSAAGAAMGGGSSGAEWQTTGLKRFASKYGGLFEFETFLLEMDPDGDRGARTNGPGRTHRCPNDDAHTDAGNEDDKGFFCVNALDDEKEQFVAVCMHDSCRGIDRLGMLDLVCQAVDIRDATELMKWVPELEDEDPEDRAPASAPAEKSTPASTTAEAPEKPASAPSTGSGPFTGMEDCKAAIDALAKDDAIAGEEVAKRIGLSTDLSPAAVDGLMKRLSKQSGIGLRALEQTRKESAKTIEKDTAKKEMTSPLDDEGMAMLAKWNRHNAIVTLGGKVRILQEPTKPGTMPPLFEIDAYRTLTANEKTLVVGQDGQVKQESVMKMWLEWPERRTYRGGIVFEPGGCTKDEYNLWRGYPVKGRKGDWSMLRDHMFENICQANPENFDWLMTWLAQMFQQPGKKLGSAVAIRGKKGTGKSKLFDWVRRAMGNHSIKVSQRGHITGQFNAHQTGVILMVCEEAFWAGDSNAGGVLKDLITSDTMMMEKKGIDIVEVSNYVRLAMVSNEDWVVPAGLEDERRFFVLECGEGRRRDIPFFQAIDRQMEAGGLEAMVHELMTWQPKNGDWNVLRQPPVTPWLVQQAMQAVTPGERFFIRLVEDGFHECPEPLRTDRTSTLILPEVDDQTNDALHPKKQVTHQGKPWFMVPIAKLRLHYEAATRARELEQKRGRAPGDDEMLKHASRILGVVRKKADGKDWQWKNEGKCWIVPPRSVIMDNLTRLGIPFQRTDCSADAAHD